MGNPKAIKDKGFDKHPENINRSGANRKTIGYVNKELEASGIIATNPKEIKDCYLRLINMDIPTLTELIKDEKQPILIRIVGKSILSGKGFEIIERMLDRAHGKAIQSSELKVEGKIDGFNIIIGGETKK